MDITQHLIDHEIIGLDKHIISLIQANAKSGGGSTTIIDGGAADGDEKVKVSSNDTTAGYLNGKLVAGTNVILTEDNNGGNETLTIDVSGVGSYTDEEAQDAVGTILVDSASIDFTYTDGTPAITATVIQSGIDHGSIGGLADDDHTQYHTDARALTWLGTRSTSDLAEGTNLYHTSERVDDRVAALIQNGTGITWTYNDAGNTLTPAVTITQYTDEMVDDRVAALIQNGTGITWSYSDAGGTLTPTVSITQYTDELAQDAIGGVVGNGLDYDDGTGAISVDETELLHNSLGTKQGGTAGEFYHITAAQNTVVGNTSGTNTGDQTSIVGITATKAQFDTAVTDGNFLYVGDITQYTDEMAQDTVSSLIQNGTGISWSYSDAGNTLTPTVSLASFSTTNLAEGSNLYHTSERVDDRVAALLTEGTNITLTYDDTANTLTIDAAGGAGAPADETYVTIGNTGVLSAERALTGTANQIVITDNGANSTVVLSTPQNIHTSATPQFARLGLGIAAHASEELNLATGGQIMVNGANPLRTLILSAPGGRGTVTAGCDGPTQVEAATNDVNYFVLDYDTTTEQAAFWIVQMPDNYDAGTVTARFVWTNAGGASTETVVWGIKARGYADSDAIDQAFGSEITVTDTWLAQGDIHISDATAAITIGGSPAGGRPVVFNVARKTGSDTMAGDARLIEVQIEYSINAFSD